MKLFKNKEGGASALKIVIIVVVVAALVWFAYSYMHTAGNGQTGQVINNTGTGTSQRTVSLPPNTTTVIPNARQCTPTVILTTMTSDGGSKSCQNMTVTSSCSVITTYTSGPCGANTTGPGLGNTVNQQAQ